MAGLQDFNGRFCESEYENTFISYLEDEGWQYLPGGSIPRDSRREVLYEDDMEQFLSKLNPDLFGEEIASELLGKANEGKIDPQKLEEGLFSGETKAEYLERIRRE